MKKILIIIPTLIFLNGCHTNSSDPNRPLKAPRGYMNETFLKLSYGLGMLDLIETEPEVPEELIAFKDLEYKHIDSTSLQLDIYKLKNLKTRRPALIFIHGGAWRTGKRADYLPYLIDYAMKGYVTVTISCRLVKKAIFPEAVQDVSCAVKWIKSNAPEYGIDPNKIVLVGGSAGGHLAMMVGFGGDEELFNRDCPEQGNNHVSAIIDLYGPVDLTTPYAVGTYQVQDFLNTTYDQNPEIFQLASPSTYISPDDPPTLIFQGTIDSLVPVSQSDSLDIWLKKAGVPHDYHRLRGWPHTMDLSEKVNEYCQFYIDAFLDEHLKD